MYPKKQEQSPVFFKKKPPKNFGGFCVGIQSRLLYRLVYCLVTRIVCVRLASTYFTK